MIKINFEETVAKAVNYHACKEDIKIIKTLKNWDEFLAHEKANYWLYWYAKYIVKGRWPEAEKYIVKNLEWTYYYAMSVIKGRWPEAEKYIIKDPLWACFYARDVIKGRWPEAEKIIKSNEDYWNRYREFLEKGRKI
jgi:hypothetical protein